MLGRWGVAKRVRRLTLDQDIDASNPFPDTKVNPPSCDTYASSDASVNLRCETLSPLDVTCEYSIEVQLFDLTVPAA